MHCKKECTSPKCVYIVMLLCIECSGIDCKKGVHISKVRLHCFAASMHCKKGVHISTRYAYTVMLRVCIARKECTSPRFVYSGMLFCTQ